MSPERAPKKRGPPKGTRIGGRQKGTKNRTTIQRELQAAHEVARAQGIGHEFATAVLERMMGELERFKNIAEGAAGLHRPPSEDELKAAGEAGLQIAKGDWGLFGQWFDRAVTATKEVAACAKDLASYQAPKIKAVDAPAPPPDPRDVEAKSRRRFGLRVFEGGKPLLPASGRGAV
jgi:hypothetical protein